MKIRVWVSLVRNGFRVHINKKICPVSYPPDIWADFPESLRVSFAEFIAFFTTLHLSFNKKTTIEYLFPAPNGEALFYFGLVLSQPENLLDFSNHLKTSDYIRTIFNSFFSISFTNHPRQITPETFCYQPRKKTALIPFTFGKDSLLTLALCKELRIQTFPIFLVENRKEYENNHRYILGKKFSEDLGESIIFFEVPMQRLKQNRGLWWGWDIFLTQYTFFLIPFLHHYKPAYFFWSNEQDRNIIQPCSEGFLVNPTFDQSARWMQVLNTGLHLFGCNTKLGSLLEPLTELTVHHVLHHRYPAFGKYQTSCNNEKHSARLKRWCAQCITCAEDFVYLLALGIDPKTVDYQDDLLSRKKKKLFYLFGNQTESANIETKDFTFFRNEQIYAFYLAYKRGIRGKLMDEYIKKYLSFAQKNQKLFQRQYVSIYKDMTVPEELRSTLLPIYKEEINWLKKSL